MGTRTAVDLGVFKDWCLGSLAGVLGEASGFWLCRLWGVGVCKTSRLQAEGRDHNEEPLKKVGSLGLRYALHLLQKPKF